jgi:predicted CxxxxCH...CXXCH cytochrome family protein
MGTKTRKCIVLPAALLALLCVQLSLGVLRSTALDNPHLPNNQVNCSICHDPVGPAAGTWWTNQGQADGLCGQCHNPTGIGKDVTTHTPAGVNLNCSDCHNPHTQPQNRTYKAASYLTTGVITSVTSTMLVTGATWTVDYWKDMMLLPDVRYPTLSYRIGSNTGNTIFIDRAINNLDAINLTYIKPGATFAVVYGRLIKNVINGRTVRFFRDSGTNSFADNNGVTDGVCQVCHTTTKYFTNAGVLDEGGHPPAVGQKCTSCHNHTSGFKPTCNECHGDVIMDSATLIFKDKDRVAVTSDSPGPGAHVKHKDAGYVCANCHTSGMLGGASQGDNLINIGFTLGGSNLGGNYDGKTGRTVYPYAGGGTTTVTATDALQCSTVYCHSSGQSFDGQSSTPVYALPKWTDPATGACGTCHKVTEAAGLTSGSHAAHLGTSGVNGCGDCHTGAADDGSSYSSTSHVNRLIDVSSGLTYTGSGAPGNGYAACTTALCHDNGRGTAVPSPMWGDAVPACTACHALQPATGTHAQHLAVPGSACAQCHAGAVEGTTAPAQHLDNNVDVYKTTAGDLGYPQDQAKHDDGNYGTCSTSACHGSGAPTWGNSTTDATCVKCHGVAGSDSASYASDKNRAAPGYVAAAAPAGTGRDTAGETLPSDSQVGAHDAHLRASSGIANALACSDCHAVAGLNDAGHMDGTVTMVWSSLSGSGGLSPSYANGACSSVYCHGDGFGAGVKGVASQPTWTNTGYLTGVRATDCNQCHQSPPASTARFDHGSYTVDSDCAGCHNHNGSGPTHVNGVLYGAGTCNSCHDYDTVAGAWGKNLQAVEGWGGHAKHIDHIKARHSISLNPDSDQFGTGPAAAVCGTCHTNTSGDHSMGGGPRSINFGDGTYRSGGAAGFNFVFGSGSPLYNGTVGVPSASDPKTCSNISCHFKETPVW